MKRVTNWGIFWGMLTDILIKKTKPAEKGIKKYDGNGLYLYITPKGAKSFRVKYTHNGKENVFTIGRYPQITLNAARIEAAKIKENLRTGVVPGVKREFSDSVTFKELVERWKARKFPDLRPATRRSIDLRINAHLLPDFSDIPVTEIRRRDLLRFLEKINAEKRETSLKLFNYLQQIFKYAIVAEICETDPTVGILDYLRRPEVTHRACVPIAEAGRLLTAIRDAKSIAPQSKASLLLLLLTWTRARELTQALKSEIDGDFWHIPAERMKMKRSHVIPLSDPAKRIFGQMIRFSHNDYIFPSINGRKALSPENPNNTLKRLGFAGIHHAHGFRSLGKTVAKEILGYSEEVTELQLAHVKTDAVSRAYDRTVFMETRHKMLSDYADWAEVLAPGLFDFEAI